GRLYGTECRAENRLLRMGAHEFDHAAVAGYEAARAGQRFRKASGDHVHFVGQTEMVGRAAPRLSKDADSMSVIHDHEAAVLLGDVEDRRKVADVALHGVDAFNCDQLWRFRVKLIENGTEMVCVVVAETLD